VGRRGQIVHLEAVGHRDLASGAPMQPDTIFRIASMTKPLTGLLAALLEEDGKLKIDDPVERHLPEFRGQQVIRRKAGDEITLGKASRPVTLLDLLTHTSGMPAMPPPGFAELYAKRDRTLAEAVVAFAQRPLEFEPGSKWQYSNTGIDVVGRVAEVVSGKPFAALLDERVLRPLGLRDTACFLAAGKRARAATLYEKQGDALEPNTTWLGGDQPGVYPLPAGGLTSTALDLARLYAALLGGGAHAGKRIARPETIAAATRVRSGDLDTGFVPGMGYGLACGVVRKPQGVTAMLSPGSFGHGGAFGTQGWCDPEKQMFFILLLQRNGLRNGDASVFRQTLQELAVGALTG
jgi:CubicO group peptidase (beta-lactamase class C family)